MAAEEAGLTLIEAIHAKYSEDAAGSICKIHISSKAPGKTDSGGIVLPPILALDNNSITSAGSSVEIAAMCGKVAELDLTNNSVTDWKQVIQIIEPMPCLKNLNLTSNKLDNQSLPDTSSQFPNLTLLVLNNTGASWETVQRLLRIFPSLSELHLSLNDYSNVRVADTVPYPPLTKLYLNKHGVTDWGEICRLGQMFPSLEMFVMRETALQRMRCTADMATVFPNLKCLHISKSQLENWEDIDCLRNFPKLCDVRMKEIPFLEVLKEKLRRQLIIARLPTVTSLNGSQIQESEREDAERCFIRHYMNKCNKPNRYFELEAIHGKLDPLVKVDLTPKVTIKVKVVLDDKEEVMDIDLKQTLREFKKFLQNFTGLPPSKFRMFHYEFSEGEFLTAEMTLLDRFLYSYRINDGDELHVIPKT